MAMALWNGAHRGRSREGAWIEMSERSSCISSASHGRSRKGVWIEILNTFGLLVSLMQMTYSD